MLIGLFNEKFIHLFIYLLTKLHFFFLEGALMTIQAHIMVT